MNAEREPRLHALEERLGHRFSDLRAPGPRAHAREPGQRVARPRRGRQRAARVPGRRRARDGRDRPAPPARPGRPGGRQEPPPRPARLDREPVAARGGASGIPELLRLGRGEEKTGGREKTALWANAFEALVAALYLDGGLEAAQRFVAREFGKELDESARLLEDPKSALQERLQSVGRPLPSYSVVAEAGPSHRRRFRVECRLDDGTVTVGEDYSKKAAQQIAARLALARLSGADSDDP